MKLGTAPCLLVVMGTLIAPTAAFGMTSPNPVANSGLHTGRIAPHPHKHDKAAEEVESNGQ